MKIAFSSTLEQEEEILRLTAVFYDSLFPRFFSASERVRFREAGVLLTEHSGSAYNGTLKEAFQLMASLQVIQAILEKKTQEPFEPSLSALLDHNISLLNENGLYFPFSSENFELLEPAEQVYLAEPVNQLLI